MAGLPQQVNWKAITVEGTAIVVSILLAFSIDAWWEQRGEQAAAKSLIDGLHADFAVSHAHLQEWSGGARIIHDDTFTMLNLIRSAEPGATVQVPFDVIVGVIGAATYDPTVATFETALASGQLDLVDSLELRNLLAVWQQQLVDTAEDEALVRNIVVNHLVPELSAQIRLGAAFDFDTLLGRFLNRPSTAPGRMIEVTVTTELEGLLAQRLFYSTFIIQGHQLILGTQKEILALLETMQ